MKLSDTSMEYRRRKYFKNMLILLLFSIGLFIPPNTSYAYVVNGTEDDNKIYFGYCDTCREGNPGLLVCVVTGETKTILTLIIRAGEDLVINGLGGDDHIQALHNATQDDTGCKFGDFGNLTIPGAFTDVYIFGDQGNDALIGTEGKQILYGGPGDDYIKGYPGDDELLGGSGNDYLCGDQDDDLLIGASGNDILVGGTGDDVINGGDDWDIFRCRSAASSIPDYDGGGASDCGDTNYPHLGIDEWQQPDPYKEWAYMTEGSFGITYHSFTTSNPLLLFDDGTAGASILMHTGGLFGGLFPGNKMWHQNSADIIEEVERLDQFGHAVATGDFDGNGYDDLAIGVPFEDIGDIRDAGVVNVMYGSSDGLTADNNQMWGQNPFLGINEQAEAGDRFGYSLAAGDFNGDGCDDLAIGAPYEDMEVEDIKDAGVVHILYGSPEGLTADNNQILHQNYEEILDRAEKDDKFGYSLASGNFNGDGYPDSEYDDLAIGVPYEDLRDWWLWPKPPVKKKKLGSGHDVGIVHILYGSSSGLSVTDSQLWHQDSSGITDEAEANDRFGFALASGDFDSSLYDDLAIGIPYEDITTAAGVIENAGAVQILYGSSDGLTADNNQVWHQGLSLQGSAETDDKFGYSLAAGDFNRNGADDLAIGIPYEDITTAAGVIENAGAVQILYGYGGLVSAGNRQFFQGQGDMVDVAEANDRFGLALASGDFNRDRDAQQSGDRFADLAVGVPYENNTGAVHILYGSLNGLTDDNNQLWTQDTLSVMGKAEEYERFGHALAFGDFNRDMTADLAIGVPGEVIIPGGAYHGAINILYGGEPLHTTHKQYWRSCGPASLNMVMEYLGLTNHSQRLYFSNFLEEPLVPVAEPDWEAGNVVDVGYKLSMEHIMYEGFWKLRHDDPKWFYQSDPNNCGNPCDTDCCDFMNSAGYLNNLEGGDGAYYEIQYNIGDYNWYPLLMEGIGKIQMWTEHSPAVGGNELPWVANRYGPFLRLSDNYLDIFESIITGEENDFENIEHVKAVIKGFIDNKTPLVAVVDNGGHFNTLMGYWGKGDDFYIYTADPLDGYGRPYYNKPMRWRKMLLTTDLADARVFIGFIKYGIKPGDCGTGGWAREVDSRFGSDSLCEEYLYSYVD